MQHLDAGQRLEEFARQLCEVPGPETQSDLPGSSCERDQIGHIFHGRLVRVTNTSGVMVIRVIGAKSFAGSKGSLRYTCLLIGSAAVAMVSG